MCKTSTFKTAGIAALALLMAATAFVSSPADAKRQRYIDAYVARDIAFDTGIVEIKEMELDDGVWEIEGWDERHREIELELAPAPAQL
ncbi:hypothetical protein A7A08_00823 [Methyloligella halotolerans]|uniref:PepSY domain-containing protein n=1 Tax=Methyloligella halotolerans TaxID=1177755 RepID=A0A1E2S3T6_9HYPH|nr:PepSY domain-containing protein [Methyloligella halotolerans]ODA68988.1 hypothetical protein A7A08_00823 [Methyloligella halotolerans]